MQSLSLQMKTEKLIAAKYYQLLEQTADANALEVGVYFNTGEGWDFFANQYNKRGYYIKLRSVYKDGDTVIDSGFISRRILFKEAQRRSQKAEREAWKCIEENLGEWIDKYKLTPCSLDEL